MRKLYVGRHPTLRYRIGKRLLRLALRVCGIPPAEAVIFAHPGFAQSIAIAQFVADCFDSPHLPEDAVSLLEEKHGPALRYVFGVKDWTETGPDGGADRFQRDARGS